MLKLFETSRVDENWNVLLEYIAGIAGKMQTEPAADLSKHRCNRLPLPGQQNSEGQCRSLQDHHRRRPKIDWGVFRVPSGELTKNYGKSPFLMGKSTISMAIFNCYLYVHQRVWWVPPCGLKCCRILHTSSGYRVPPFLHVWFSSEVAIRWVFVSRVKVAVQSARWQPSSNIVGWELLKTMKITLW